MENDTIHTLSHQLRAGLNLVSGSFSIGVISRLSDEEDNNLDVRGETHKPFDNYRGWIRGLLNASNGLTEHSDNIKKLFANLSDPEIDELPLSDEEKERTKDAPNFYKNYLVQGPFYRTEIAWLCNERGLITFVQGHIYESIKFFDNALEQIKADCWVAPHQTEYDSARSSYRRISINKAIARLEAGKIEDSSDTLQSFYKHDTSDGKVGLSHYLAAGYLGLCHHLAGRKKTAKKYYLEALTYFENKRSHMRTVAISRRHLADLYSSNHDFKKAKTLINQAISTAASAEQQDILNHAYVSKAKLLIWSGKDISAANELLRQATEYAIKMGLPK